ncbi:MAG: sigma-70 family RNA polymerase sigma factor [Balneolaceae bacterium]|nr:sigma-70 family RNA polymerase sigma factor [Balneolaceae bacterium]MDR9407696.1 sigma-70 family RNA polymerase sigma factor [Balneolaceae bacterium]
MDDSALVEQIQRVDQQAFTVLMERWQTRIHRFAFRFFADVDEASEITQKTFIKVYQKVDTLDEPGKFSSWIYRVANNLCLDELKRAGRRKSSPLEAWVEQMEASQTPAKKLETKELGEVLQKALLTLPDEQRVVIILKEYEGMKFREIAEILEEPENTVKSRMYYGLKSLRRVLKKWNIQNEYLNHD